MLESIVSKNIKSYKLKKFQLNRARFVIMIFHKIIIRIRVFIDIRIRVFIDIFSKIQNECGARKREKERKREID